MASRADGLSAALIEALYDPAVVACVAGPDAAAGPLSEAEAACVARASSGRLAEFRAGRGAAKAALRRLGVDVESLPMRPDRSPAWPAGYVGSLSHCAGACAAVAAHDADAAGLGFDLEAARPLAPELAALVGAGPAPRPVEPAIWPTVVFSVKEAVYKCQRPLTGVFLDFADVALVPCAAGGGRGGRFEAHLRPDAARGLGGRRIEGAWRLAADLVVAAAWTVG